MQKPIMASLVAATLACGTAAFAEGGLYYGVGAAIGFATSGEGNFGGGDESEAKLPLLGFVVGYRQDQGSRFFSGELDGEIGAKTEFTDRTGGQKCADGAAAPYYCNHSATVRLRGLYGTSLANGMEAFGSVGFVGVFGQSANGPVTVADVTSTGYTVGAGVQRALASGAKLRFELVYDQADQSSKPDGYLPKYKAATLKVGYIF